jgi:hypothetical protein
MATGSITPLFPDARMTRPPTISPLHDDHASLCQQLAEAIANAADADQWAIAVQGVCGTGPADFDEWLPREVLQRLNGDRPAAYRLTLVLCHDGCDLGIVRLGTIRPSGFSPEDVALARMEVEYAASMLRDALDDQRSVAVAA